MSSKRVAVVTGSNKGIGYEVIRGLCKSNFDGDIILTARNPKLGEDAVQALKAEGLNPIFHQLDIGDKDSINRLRDYLQEKYGGLDILVNNAAIAFKAAAKETFDVQAVESMKINFWGTLNVCDALFPLLRPHARVSHVGSFVSAWSARKCSDELMKKFLDKDLTMDKVTQLIKDFVQAAQEGKVKERGWPESAYGTSKIGVYLMTVVQQNIFNQNPEKDLIVNCCCPGSVQTDMSSQRGYLKPEQGAKTPLYAVLLKPNCAENPKGKFLYKKKVWTWPGEIGSDAYLKE